jgi:sugar phosphate isomerase/epimerase
MTFAGVDPVAQVKRFADAGRLPLLHLKDMNPEDRSFTELGCGCVPLAECIAAAAESDCCKWLVYEQDKNTIGDLKSAQISITNLKKMLGY